MVVKKSFIMVCLMILIMIIIGGVSASEDIDSVSSSGDLNSTLKVNDIDEVDNLASDNGADSDDGNVENLSASNDNILKEDSVGTFSDLSTDLGQGSEINLNKNYKAATAGTTGITIGTGITLIDGKGHYLDANNLGRIFTIQAGAAAHHHILTLQNIKFVNGKATAGNGAGAILVNGYVDLTLINCTFENNTHDDRGGAIYFAANCAASFTNCNFTNNYLTVDGGGETTGGGAIHFAGDTNGVIFDKCTFDSNWVIPKNNHIRAYGGGIVFEGAAKNNQFLNCTFKDNYCKSGTRLYVAGDDGHQGHPKGGAIYFKSTSEGIHIEDCNFTNNTLQGVLLDSSGYTTYAYGGALCFEGAAQHINIANSIFDNNLANSSGKAAESYGGAIAFLSNANNINLTSTDFYNNTAYCSIYTDSDKGSTNNPAPRVKSFGGAIYFGNPRGSNAALTFKNIDIIDCDFEDNKANVGEYGDSRSGAIEFNGNTLTNMNIVDTNFSRNSATDDYPVLTFIKGVSDLSFTRVTFEDNHGKTAPLYFGSDVVRTYIINSTFRNNENNASTDSNGGAIYVTKATSLTINGTTFDNNTVKNNGGGLYVASGSGVSVDNCTFMNHNVSGNGGGIYWANGDFITSNSHFINNTASDGPNIYFAGTSNQVSLTNTEFTNGTATTGNGGALNIPANVNTITINDCSFTGNKVTNTNANGGALYINGNNVDITGSDFKDNHATGEGNDVYLTNDVDTTTISTSTFEGKNNIYSMGNLTLNGNAEVNPSDDSEYFIMSHGKLKLNGNSLTNVIYNDGTISTHVIINISGNKTYTFDDYVFNLTAKITDDAGNIIISPSLNYTTYGNPTIQAADNETHDGSFLTKYAEHKTYLVNATDSSLPDKTILTSVINVILRVGTYTWLQDKMDNLNGNVLDLDNDVTFDPYYDMSVHNMYHGPIDFTNGMKYNKTITLNGNDHTISGLNQARIFSISVPGTTIKDTSFINGSADNGGALFIAATAGNAYIKDCNFTNNNATSTGGAVYYVSSASASNKNITVENCKFEGNNAFGDQTITNDKGNGVGCGGALHLEGANHKLMANDFTNNNVNGNYAYGGAVYLDGSGHNLLNNNFTNNGANGLEANGGAVFSYADYVTVTSNRFVDNHATYWGGAFVDGYETNNILIEDSTFIRNTARNAGAVDLFETPAATVTNCLFDDNRASNKAGALYMNGVNGIISYCNFTNNKANYSSAISYTPEDPNVVDPTKANITHCNFINNVADKIGTVRFDSCEGNINYCNFTDNTAASAGAIYVCMKDVTIEHCNFNGNNATDGNGGAILVDNKYDGTSIRDCDFTKNHASEDGGAIYLGNSKNTVSNCGFTNNTANGKGGALYSDGDNVNISDSTFSKNTADNGGAIYYQNSGNGLCIYNDTFTNNIAEFNGGAVYYNALREYNNFDGNAIPVDATSKRVNWNDAGKQVIFTSLFENNIDYLMDAVALGNDIITINVAVPRGVSGYRVNVTVYKNGTVVTATVSVDQPRAVDGHTVIPVYVSGLEEGKYNATVGFSQGNVYLYKEDNVSFTVGNPTEGAFTTLQKLIDDALEQARLSGNPAVVDLTGPVIYTQGKDHGQINITGPITINGHNFLIDATGLTRIFDIRSEGVILNDIIFSRGNANGNESTSADKVNGGAILWEGANGVINNCIFEDAAGSSAVYVLNSNNFYVNDTEFTNNNCSPISVSASNGTIANSTFTSNDDEMDIAGASLVTVSDSTFASTGISVNSAEKVTLYNLTINDSNVAVDSDVEMEDIKAAASPIRFNAGNSSVVASAFSGANPIEIDAAAEVHLTKVNTTAEANGVSVLNGGTLYLSENNFGNVIDNVNGQIKSSTTIWVLNNNTVISKAGTNVELNATIVDDNNNTIKVGSLVFTLNGASIGSGNLQTNGYYTKNYAAVKGVYTVSIKDTVRDDLGLANTVYKNGILKVKVDPADVGDLVLNITQNSHVVTIKAILPGDETGNVSFAVNGVNIDTLNKTVEIDETTHIATLTLTNLVPGEYSVTAKYMGDDTHFEGSPQSGTFVVSKFPSNIEVKVNDTLCGQDAIAVITTNATGNVTIIFGDQIKKVEITNGKYEWNLSNSLAPRFYTISAYFEANKFADSSFTSSNFTVYNYTVDVTVSETQFNQSANITVTIAPQQAIGSQPPVIRLDGEILHIAFSQNGVYIATTDKITKTGQHTVNVTYAGNGTLFYPKEIIKTFNVSATDAYEFNVEITEKPYGENTTIVVTGPEGANVTVNVDGVNYTVTVGDDGKGNLTLNNLTAGPHHIVANFTGDENHTGKSVVKDITVPKQTPDIQVIVPDNITPGSPANVTVVVGKNATGNVIITIDNVPTMVKVTNGTAVVPIPTNKPGDHNITVQYAGDDNYAAPGTVTKANYTVDKYDAEKG